MKLLDDWFAAQDWTAFDYQRQAWDAYLRGASGLIHAPTGTGKTYAAWLGPLREWLQTNPDPAHWNPDNPEPLRIVWITPMRALASDILVSLQAPILELGIPCTVDRRTGDTSTATRRRQRERLPTCLVTTPESLSLLLSYSDADRNFRGLQAVIVDEWHELLGTKRGVQTELCLARLRKWNSSVRTWGVSATLGNLDQALHVLLGDRYQAVSTPYAANGFRVPGAKRSVSQLNQQTKVESTQSPVIISGELPKQIEIETLLPLDVERFPWAGHLGLKLLPQVIQAISEAKTTLLFTNTRSHCEIWFRALLAERKDWAAELAVHHGSLDRDLRSYVEARLRAGSMRCVVCTSSLDLGVDFSPVDQVIQVGSPKGVARLLQRAGRSGHQPGAISRIVCVPTHAFELVEYAGARNAALAHQIEGRDPQRCPLDVLVQHMVTVALSGGFNSEELLDEVRTTYAYRDLTDLQWQWALDFCTRGGHALRAYPEYARLTKVDDRYVPTSAKFTRWHRMSIGTITSDASMVVKYMKGGSLGTIEESFIARLKPDDRFVFAGHTLELVRTRDMIAYVRKAKQTTGSVPRWDGGRFPLSSQLAAAVRHKFSEARRGDYIDPEMQCVRPILELQRDWSHLPAPDQLLIERSKVREGYQTFIYPFEGRSVNEGLAALLAFRISRDTPCSITVTPNDYGFELLSNIYWELDEVGWRKLLSPDNLIDDLLGCLNATELARRQFRDIARVAGLVFSGYPGAPESARQLQASSSLLYDVFVQYDPENLLLQQARREVLDQQLEAARMQQALERMAKMELSISETDRLSPLSFPLWAARIQTTHLSSEKWSNRIQRMVLQLEQAAGRRQPISLVKATHHGWTSPGSTNA